MDERESSVDNNESDDEIFLLYSGIVHILYQAHVYMSALLLKSGAADSGQVSYQGKGLFVSLINVGSDTTRTNITL